MEGYQTSFFSNMIVERNCPELYGFMVRNLANMLPPKRKSPFDGTVFEDMWSRGPHTRGKVGEKLVTRIAQDNGYIVEKSSGGDRRINGIDIEIKTAMLNSQNGFTFNQIRPQPYRYVVCVTIAPGDVNIFTVPRDEMIALATGQHGGSKAKETHILNVSRKNLHKVLGRYSGVERFLDIMRV